MDNLENSQIPELEVIENDVSVDNKKETNDLCTIYLLTNKINGKIYIGQTWLTLNKRMGKNGSNYKNSTYLYSALQKYGSDNFEYTVLDTYDNQKDADEAEAKAITEYNSLKHEIGYNLKLGGVAGRHTEETKAKISANHSKPGLGKIWTEEMRQVLREAMTGRVLTPEHREKVVQTLQYGGFEGHHHTDETKEALSNKFKGQKRDPKAVAQGSATLKAKKDNDGIIAAYKDGMTARDIAKKFNIGTTTLYRLLDEMGIKKEREFKQNLKGKKLSEETKAKMSQSAKELWDDRKESGEGVERPRSAETIAKTAATRRARTDWDKIVSEYQSGSSIDSLAETYDVGVTTIYRHIKEKGIALK